MSEPNKTRADCQAEITAIVGRLQEIQRAEKLSDRQLLARYPDIGSAKTWTDRLQPFAWEQINAERTAQRLARVAAILDGGSPDELFLAEMGFSIEMQARVGLLEQQTNDRRILVCLAPNGCGKSAYARWAVAQKRAQRALVRCRPTWRNKMLHICAGICRALGTELASGSPAEAEAKAIELLSQQPRTVFIDQAHEGSVAVMHLLRSFIDETPSRFVYLAYDTAYRKVATSTSDALIEARAFTGRCLKPVFDLYAGGTRAPDVQLYLRKVGGLSTAVAEGVASKVLPTLTAHTNLRLLDDAITSAAAFADDGEPDPAKIVSEVSRLAGHHADAGKGGAK